MRGNLVYKLQQKLVEAGINAKLFNIIIMYLQSGFIQGDASRRVEDLQKMLDTIKAYTDRWKLEVKKMGE